MRFISENTSYWFTWSEEVWYLCIGIIHWRILTHFVFYYETDPFAEANGEDSSAGAKDYVHIRTQQRNGRKSLTTVQGLKKEFNYNKILKDFKKEFCCNGSLVEDPELGQVWIL